MYVQCTLTTSHIVLHLYNCIRDSNIIIYSFIMYTVYLNVYHNIYLNIIVLKIVILNLILNLKKLITIQ